MKEKIFLGVFYCFVKKNCNLIVKTNKCFINRAHSLFLLYADVSNSLSTLVGFILPELKSCFLKALILSELSLTEAPVGPELLDIEIEAVEKMDEAVVESEAD